MYGVISRLAEGVEHIVDPLGQKVCVFQRTDSVCVSSLLRQIDLLKGADFLCHTLGQHTNLIDASIGICT